MPDFKIVHTEDIPFLYEERTTSMDPQDIGAAMGEAFGSVMSFMGEHGIAPGGKVMAAYYTYSPDSLTFRAGCSVAAPPSPKTDGPIGFDTIPAGRAVHFQHKGSYAGLRNDYDALMEYLKAEKLEMVAPTWEVYLNDPFEVPEDELLTDVFTKIA